MGGPDEAARRTGLVVLVGFLAVGLALWVVLLSPGKAPERPPLAPKSPATGQASASAGSGLPEGHPPLGLPEDVKKILADLQQKAESRPQDLEAWKNAAQAEYRAGQVDRSYLEKAEASFRHVLELDASDLDAIRGVGNVHFDREEYPKAIEAYTRYLALKPADASVRTDLGTMYLYSGEPEKAFAEYEKALVQDPKFYQAHYNLGIAYAQGGQTAKALDSLRRARELAPDDGTRKQIDTMIDRVTKAAERPSSAGADEPKSFQGRVEEGLRRHPILGPKIAKVEWTSPTEARVRLRDFPMQGMPETARQKFLDRLKGELAGAKREGAVTEPARVDLVDDQSGEVMATVSAE
jgi:tetratricopeptide (TPR) repeat protein